MTKGKKFDKKNSVTYRLVPNNSGPSQFEEDAPKYVFVPVPKGSKKVPCLFPPPPCPEEPVKTERVFPSKGPRPDWDPDVVAALDDDFDFEDPDNALDDDFIAKANDGRERQKADESSDEGDDEGSIDFGSDFSGEADDYVGELPKHMRNQKAKSTNYSMTSAVSNCSENVKSFNERFEKMLESYDDDKIGALDFEEIDGHLQPECERMEKLFIDELKKEETMVLGDYNDETRSQILTYAKDDTREEFITITTEKPQVEFDCESYISTYSNIYNHPTVIKYEGKISAQAQRRRLTKSKLKHLEKEQKEAEEEDSDDASAGKQSVSTASCARPKDETTEQRKERKKIIKEMRKENRAIKKENKLLFKAEKMKQDSETLNNRRNAGMKMV